MPGFDLVEGMGGWFSSHEVLQDPVRAVGVISPSLMDHGVIAAAETMLAAVWALSFLARLEVKQHVTLLTVVAEGLPSEFAESVRGVVVARYQDQRPKIRGGARVWSMPDGDAKHALRFQVGA